MQNNETAKITERAAARLLTEEEWRAYRDELEKADRDAVPEILAPPSVFDDVRASDDERRKTGHRVRDGKLGADSFAVESRLELSCGDWKRLPTARDFHRAIHDPQGTKEERAMLFAWFVEATIQELMDARLEGAYSWQQLATALHRHGLRRGPGAQRMNRFARRARLGKEGSVKETTEMTR